MPPPPALTVVVPATDAPPTLARCTRAIAAAADPPEQVVVVEHPSRTGPAAARNAGAALAGGEILVFVDADVEVAPDAFTRIRAAFVTDPGLDAVFGSYDAAPAAPGTVSRFRNLLHHHVHQRGAGPATTFWAGLGAVRRDRFEAAGGFDARRFAVASIEDVELGMRLVAGGARIELDPALRGTHLKAWTLPEMLRTDFARRAVPWLRLLLEARAGSSALNLGARHRLSALACVALVAATAARRPAPAASALATLIALNASFYALLARREGPTAAVAGVALHVLHHLSAVAAIPTALACHMIRRSRMWSRAQARGATALDAGHA